MNSNVCLICHGHSTQIKKLEKYAILKCLTCGLEFTSPMPSAKVLGNFYSGYNDFHAPDDTVSSNARRNIRLLSKYGLTRKSRLLDYGSGKNLFVPEGKSPSWHGYDRYTENCGQSLLKDKYDFITLWGVLEHLPHPIKEVQMLARLLKPQGQLALTTVGTETGIPYRYKPPEHVTYWTQASMRKLFHRCGLKIVTYEPYFMQQRSEIYLRCIFNAAKVPDGVRKHLHWKGKSAIVVPTNEVLVVAVKRG
jgi:hypothetical protein